MRWRRGTFYSGIASILASLAVCASDRRSASAADLAQPAARGNWGAGRCSATACHGSPTPVYGGRVFRNEHTVWASRDRHAGAYQTLHSEVSRSIARKLGQTAGRVVAAHLDPRCLACHSTPGPAIDPALSATIRQDGVGCESCHGSASDWLSLHTTYDWDALPPLEKESRYGQVRLDDLAVRAERCAGCHVGAPAANGLPAREVDHDLIAAGHPRLNFEFSSFLANLPPHWVETGQNASGDFPARTWAVGQLVSARCALQLLQNRARVAAQAGPDRPSSWPEFSEYDCASCHQELRAPASGAAADRTTGGPTSRPGLAPWGTWYYPLVSSLNTPGAADPIGAAADACLGRLRASFDEPAPDPARVAGLADEAAQALGRWLRRVEHESFAPPRTEALIRSLRRQDRSRTDPASGRGWDLEAQIFLGLAPLRQSLAEPARSEPGLLDELRDRRTRLLAPFTPARSAATGVAGAERPRQ